MECGHQLGKLFFVTADRVWMFASRLHYRTSTTNADQTGLYT